MRFLPVSVAAAVGLLAAATAVVLPVRPVAARRLLSPAAAVGDTKTEARPVTGEFRTIAVQTSDNVVIRQGSPAAISITGPAEELARTQTVIEKGQLTISKEDKSRSNWRKGQAAVSITVTVPVVEMLNVNGSGDLRTENTLTGSQLSISLAGSGDVRVSAEVSGTCSTSIAGSGNVQLSGRCGQHSVRVSGSGNVRASELRATDATVKISGSGNITLAAAENLDVDISGSGNVRYAEKPIHLSSHVSGSGTVTKM